MYDVRMADWNTAYNFTSWAAATGKIYQRKISRFVIRARQLHAHRTRLLLSWPISLKYIEWNHRNRFTVFVHKIRNTNTSHVPQIEYSVKQKTINLSQPHRNVDQCLIFTISHLSNANERSARSAYNWECKQITTFLLFPKMTNNNAIFFSFTLLR